MKVTLYSTHCPKCNIITKKLIAKNIVFTEVNDIETIKNKGYFTVPVLEVDDKVFSFKEANDWINAQKG